MKWIPHRKPLHNRLTRRMWRKSGYLYLPCDSFFCMPVSDDKPVLMLIDTGTTASILRKDFVECMLNPKRVKYVSSDSIMTASGNIASKGLLWIPFEDSNGRRYREDFLVIDKADSLDWLSKETGYIVAGILGTSFMERHKMIINFKTKEVVL